MELKKLARSSHAVGQNCFHLIWCPKYRYPVFRFSKMQKECEDAIYFIADKYKMTVHNLCVEKDHLHVFIELPATISVSKSFQLLKGGTSYILRKNNPWMRKYKALWSIGKFYRSVGAVTDKAIGAYISDSHHISKRQKNQKTLI